MTAALTTLGNRVDLVLYLPDEDWAGKYNAIEVQRSRYGNGLYESLHGSTYTSPSFKTTLTSNNVSGKYLELLVDETHKVSLTFTGTNPLTVSQMVSQVNTAGAGLVTASAIDSSTFEVKANNVGMNTTMRVNGGEAAALLGLPLEEPDSLAFGKDLYKTVSTKTEVVDLYGGRSTTTYRFRYVNTLDGSFSEWSQDITKSNSKKAMDNLVVGYLKAIDGFGRPIANNPIIIETFTASTSHYDISNGRERFVTDEDGNFETTFIKGSRAHIAVTGTDIVRMILVPSDIDRFDLLSPDYSVDSDRFSVAKAPRDYAQRR